MKKLLIPYYLIVEYLLIGRHKITSLPRPHPPANYQQGSNGDVLVIPGINEIWFPLKPIADALNRLGYRIHIVEELGTNRKPVLHQADIVSEYIRHHRLDNLMLLTHSKGGLIGLTLLQDREINKRIRKVITIACPAAGSAWAHLFGVTREMAPNSPLIKNILTGCDLTKIVNIYPRIDNHVVPNRNLIIPGADNICLDLVGHTRILESPETLKLISYKIAH